MQELYKSSLLLVHSLTQLCGICYKYRESPSDEVGEKIIEIVDNCEKKFLKVKEEIVKIVRDVEMDTPPVVQEEISAIKTESGFLINKD